MFYRIMTLLTLSTAIVPGAYSAASVISASLDSLLTPNITTEIVAAIADKPAGFISEIDLSGKKWNMFKLPDGDVESKIRMDINVELSRMQSTSSRGDGVYTFLMRQPIGDRHIYRVINFEVKGARIDFKEQLGLVEFTLGEHGIAERPTESAPQQSRVHESSEHIHQSRVHESEEHVHQARVHESDEHVHQPHGLVAPSTAPALSAHLATLFNQENTHKA